ncbi:MAG: O-antigen ligase family protein [Patescibacteria group bacterium]
MIFSILLLIAFATFLLLAWRDLKLALIVLAGLLPTYLIRFSIGPLPTTALEVFILIAGLAWVINHQGYKIDIKSFRPWYRPLLLLIAAASFGVVVASDTFSALGIWKAYFIEPALVYLMMQSQFKGKDDWQNALKALGVSAIVLSVFAIFQSTSGLGIPAPWDIEKRATGLFDYPNALGLFLSPIIAFGTVLFIKTKNKTDRIFWSSVIVLGAIAILLAQTEAAFVAIPAALLITFLITPAKRTIKIRVAAEAIIIVILLALAFPAVGQKIMLRDYSGQVRIAQWQESVAMIVDRPLFGAGLNAYPTVLKPYHDPKLYEIFQYPHNIFLNIWSELGLLGLIAFFWLAFLIIQTVRFSTTKQIKNSTTLKLAAFAALTTMAIHGLVDVPYFKNDLAVMTWILIAILSMPRKSVIPKK